MKTLLNVIETRLLRRPGWLRTSSAPAILVFETCFTVGELAVPWDAVSRIEAWRGDPSGGIRIGISADVGAAVITVAEGQRGFDDFVAMADRRMTFPLGWWERLETPGARRHGFTLFERACHA
jgi:hypothetical protein